jgi:hypothetical protein
MRTFLKPARHSRTRLFVPVVEYGLTEFAVTVRQVEPKPHVPQLSLPGALRLNRRTLGGILGSPEQRPVSSREGDEDMTLQQERAALVPDSFAPEPQQLCT